MSKKIAVRLVVITLLIIAFTITGTMDYQDKYPDAPITVTKTGE